MVVGDVVSSHPKAQKQLTGQRVVGKAGARLQPRAFSKASGAGV